MRKALRLKSGQLINPDSHTQEELIEFCGAGGLWIDVDESFFPPAEAKVLNIDGSEPERGEEGLIPGEPVNLGIGPLPPIDSDADTASPKANTRRRAARKAAERNAEGEK